MAAWPTRGSRRWIRMWNGSARELPIPIGPIGRLRCENGRDLSRSLEMLEIPRYSPRAVCASRRSVARVLSPKCIFGDIIVKLGNVERRAAALFHARRATAAQNRLEAKSSHGRQIVKERRGQWGSENAAKPAPSLATRASLLATSFYLYARLLLWFNRRGARAPKTSGQIQKIFGGASRCGVRRSRFEARIWRAYGGWLFLTGDWRILGGPLGRV
jgi:hypothetical protein